MIFLCTNRFSILLATPENIDIKKYLSSNGESVEVISEQVNQTSMNERIKDLYIEELEKDIKKFLTDRSIKQIDLMNKYNISRNTLKKYIEYIANKKCI